MHTIHTNLLFTGFCPACSLKGGANIDLLLNSMDFYECPQCRIQLTMFPPYAVILRWEGEGQFRETVDKAIDHYKDLLLCKASIERGQEIYPDGEELLDNSFDLEAYIEAIHPTEAAYFNSRLKMDDPTLKVQEEYLSNVASEEWENLCGQYKEAKKAGFESAAFSDLHRMFYDLKVVFPFDWKSWEEGIYRFQKGKVDFSSLSLLQLSMYLTLICRSDHFDGVSIQLAFDNGILDQIFMRIEQIT